MPETGFLELPGYWLKLEQEEFYEEIDDPDEYNSVIATNYLVTVELWTLREPTLYWAMVDTIPENLEVFCQKETIRENYRVVAGLDAASWQCESAPDFESEYDFFAVFVYNYEGEARVLYMYGLDGLTPEDLAIAETFSPTWSGEVDIGEI